MAKIARLERSLRAETTGLVLFDALYGYLHPKDPGKTRFLEERNILPNMTRPVPFLSRVHPTRSTHHPVR